ncbi:MAG: VPLPA-CTERM sorting domain-containing protein [Gammaproteobacteria bacterium]
MIMKNIRFINIKQFMLITSSLGISSVSNAALFDCVSEAGYCIGEGNTVIFKYAGTTSSIGLFGTVEVIGDSIVSFPTDFRAESVDGEGTALLSDNGTVQVIAKSGYQIDGVNIKEIGDYLMTGAGSTVDVDGWSKIYDWNNILFGESVQQNLDITGDLTIIDSSTHTWDAATSFDLTGSNWDGINHIGLQLQNNLSAYTSADGDIAWIEKKITGGSIDFSVATTVIPVPAAVWLFGSGLLGLAGMARRKSA